MYRAPVLKGNFYHVYNRGNQKQRLFHDDRDYIRFLFLMLHLQSTTSFRNIDRQVNNFLKHGIFKIDIDEVNEINDQKHVEIICFCIMPNHFHLCLKNISENGISKYCQKVLTAYSMYFNTKYHSSGHVFQGKTQIKLIEDENYLDLLTAYIHNNPTEVNSWNNKINKYPWSSFTDYNSNRWPKLLRPQTVLNRFKNFEDYELFVKTSNSKQLDLKL